MFYEWTDQLSVGVPSIDRQHKVLISLINELHDAMDKRAGALAAKNVLKRVINYAQAHFIYEEGLFSADRPAHGRAPQNPRKIVHLEGNRGPTRIRRIRGFDAVFEKLAEQSHPERRHGLFRAAQAKQGEITSLPIGNGNMIASLRIRLMLQISSHAACPPTFPRNTLEACSLPTNLPAANAQVS